MGETIEDKLRCANVAAYHKCSMVPISFCNYTDITFSWDIDCAAQVGKTVCFEVA